MQPRNEHEESSQVRILLPRPLSLWVEDLVYHESMSLLNFGLAEITLKSLTLVLVGTISLFLLKTNWRRSVILQWEPERKYASGTICVRIGDDSCMQHAVAEVKERSELRRRVSE